MHVMEIEEQWDYNSKSQKIYHYCEICGRRSCSKIYHYNSEQNPPVHYFDTKKCKEIYIDQKKKENKNGNSTF